jgi:hypothetical protein
VISRIRITITETKRRARDRKTGRPTLTCREIDGEIERERGRQGV